MIKITQGPTQNGLEITVEGALQVADFHTLRQQADEIIAKYNSIRILINAENFHGWDDLKSIEEHFSFIREHHQKVERIAMVVGHMWQRIVASAAQIFLHPDIKIFTSDELETARKWIAS